MRVLIDYVKMLLSYTRLGFKPRFLNAIALYFIADVINLRQNILQCTYNYFENNSLN